MGIRESDFGHTKKTYITRLSGDPDPQEHRIQKRATTVEFSASSTHGTVLHLLPLEVQISWLIIRGDNSTGRRE